MPALRHLDPADVAAPAWSTLVDAVVAAAVRGPAGGVPRSRVPLAHGEFLLMPAESARTAGVKIVGIAPANPASGLPRIQGLYLLCDAVTLVPLALVDGPALTVRRTAAVSAAAVLACTPATPLDLVVLGTGPQADGHVAVLAALRGLRSLTVVGRDAVRATAFAQRCADRVDGPVRVATGDAAPALAAADVVVCATTAREPLFDGALVRDDAVVVAVGSHEPDARELDELLLGRSSVVVESVDTALREAGDVIQAVAAGAVRPDELVTLARLLTDGRPAGGPVVVKTVGEAWQDLAVAEALVLPPTAVG